MSFSRYGDYCASGIEWIGQRPTHWNQARLASLFREVNEPGNDGLPVLSVSIHNGVSDKELDEDELDRKVTRSDDRSKYKKVQPGDLVYNMMRAWQGGFGTVKVAGMVSPAYVVARPKVPVCTEFVESLLRTPSAIEELRRHSKGVTDFRLRLYWEEFKSIRIVVPSLDEQQAIMAFLAHETTKISTLIAEQERLMDLLTEKVAALALPSVASAGIGQCRLGDVATIVSRPVVQTPGESYIAIGLYNRGRGLFHKESRQADEMGDSDFFWIEDGDLIISGQFAWEGAVALAGPEDNGCVVSHRYPVIRGKHGIALTEYLLALLTTKHGTFLLNENSRGAAGRNRPLNIDALLKEKIPVPNLRTQEVIASALRRRNELFSEASKQARLFRERRAALISAAVTGRIDVRRVASGLQIKEEVAA
jgi:type I restriction enzyme S subunit